MLSIARVVYSKLLFFIGTLTAFVHWQPAAWQRLEIQSRNTIGNRPLYSARGIEPFQSHARQFARSPGLGGMCAHRREVGQLLLDAFVGRPPATSRHPGTQPHVPLECGPPHSARCNWPAVLRPRLIERLMCLGALCTQLLRMQSIV